MFVASRDLIHARGRFLLMTTVVALVTFLVTLIASLTSGLSRESTSAITGLDVDLLAFGMPTPDDAPDVTASRVTEDEVARWAAVPGVEDATALGFTMTRVDAGRAVASVALVGIGEGSVVQPGVVIAPGRAVVSVAARSALGVDDGDSVEIAGELFPVTVSSVDASLSHAPAVWVALDDWRRLSGADDGAATVVAVRGHPEDAALTLIENETGARAVSVLDARSAVSSYVGENTSLTLMQAFLMAISALVVGAFFTVWTMGRTGDIAVLKALGGSESYLLRDALAQATAVLLAGVAGGCALTIVVAAVLPTEVPVAVSASTMALPGLGIVVLGLAGAGVAIARIGRIDPHSALAAR